MRFKGPAAKLLIVTFGLLGGLSQAEAQGPSKEKRPTLDMSKAVACEKIEGYEKFKLLPDASLTSDEKLQVYYRPLDYKVMPTEKPKPGFRYRAKFSQDGRIRKKGEKAILMKKDKILEYEPTFDDPTERIYLINNVGLKGLPPGEYEYDIILRDELADPSAIPAMQTISFTIIPLKYDPTKVEEPTEPTGTVGSKTESKSARKTSKKSRAG